MNTQNFCRGCGHSLRPAAQFCTSCGRPAATNRPEAAALDQSVHQAAAAAAPDARDSYPPAPAAVDHELRDPLWPQAGPAPSNPLWPQAGPASAEGDTARERVPSQPVLPLPGGGQRPPRRAGSTHRSRSPLIAGLAVVGLAALGGAAFLALTLFKHHHPPHAVTPLAHSSASLSPTPSSPAPSSPPSPPPATAPTEQQAATTLAGLLGNSVSDRSSVNAAYNDALQCGPDLPQDAQAFSSAATARQQLLSQLATMPGRSVLPSQLLSDLTAAWKVSVQADQDFAAWAQDQASGSCTPDGQADPHFQAADGPDLQATQDKKAFIKLWNPLASKYGLTTYQQGEL